MYNEGGTVMNTESVTVKRKIQCSSLIEQGDVQTAIEILAGMPGMIEAQVEDSGNRIRVQYDVTKLQYPDLIRTLKSRNLLKELGWWERFKYSSYRFQDKNLRDNAMANPAPCCSNPEEILQQGPKH